MSLWSSVAGLPLLVESCTYDRLDPPEVGERSHPRRVVQLHGGGHTGLGEDITLFLNDGEFEYPIAGEWTVESFCAHLGEIEQWPGEQPEWDMARRWRNWSYESAALDLALQQAGRPLHEVVGGEPRPVRYVNSFGLGEPASCDTVHHRLALYPDLRFKLDAAPDWTEEICATLVETGAVDVIDFKGQYGLDIEDEDALLRSYELLLRMFPDAIIEDPHDVAADLVAPHADRVSYDAPIASVADLDAQTHRVGIINLKPTRIGSLQRLSELYDECTARGYTLYGGGMGELGVARGQIQLLAALYHPDGPNDIAPPGFNDPEPGPGLPPSPLDPDPAPTGFQRLAG